MMGIIKVHKKIKWVVFFVLLGAMIVIGITSLTTMKQLDNLSQSLRDRDLQLIGTFGVNPITEQAILEIWKGIKNEEAIERGKKLLEPYGYIDEFQTDSTTMIKHLKNQIIITYLIILFATGICCAILLLLVIYIQKMELNQIAQIVNGFIREDYTYMDPIIKEGVELPLSCSS
jgi:hypothetical protein